MIEEEFDALAAKVLSGEAAPEERARLEQLLAADGKLRAQFAEARKRQAELQSELGPRHPALRQMEQQVEDLRRTINEEVNRYAQSAKNDFTSSLL